MSNNSPGDSGQSLLPAGLPILARGRHHSPQQGASFMEFASVLAGEPFSDHPRCTHPLVALLAQAIDDAVDEDTRQGLLTLVPEAVGVTGGLLQSAHVVRVVTGITLLLLPEPRPRCLLRAHARARRRTTSTGCSRDWVRATEWLYRGSAGRRAVLASVAALRDAGGGGLRELLAEVLRAGRELAKGTDLGVSGDGKSHSAARPEL